MIVFWKVLRLFPKFNSFEKKNLPIIGDVPLVVLLVLESGVFVSIGGSLRYAIQYTETGL